MAGNDNPPDESGLPPRLSADGQAHIDHFALERGGIVRLDTMRLRQTGEHPALPLGVRRRIDQFTLIEADDPAALQGEVIDVGLTIG